MRKSLKRWHLVDPKHRKTLERHRSLSDDERKKLASMLGYRHAPPIILNVNGVEQRVSAAELVAALRALVTAIRCAQKDARTQPTSHTTDAKILSRLLAQLERFIETPKNSPKLRKLLELFVPPPPHLTPALSTTTIKRFSELAGCLLAMLNDSRTTDALPLAQALRGEMNDYLDALAYVKRHGSLPIGGQLNPEAPDLSRLRKIRPGTEMTRHFAPDVVAIWRRYAKEDRRDDSHRQCEFAEWVFELCDLPAPRYRDHRAEFEAILRSER